ncbi:hypothetical protein D3C71_1801840 [compost metagenome]
MRVEPHALAFARRQHEVAYAVARFHHARGLELGQRLAHHGAADVIAANQLRLGGQLVSLMQQALADLLPELLRQQIGQAAAAAAGLAAQRRPVRRR